MRTTTDPKTSRIELRLNDETRLYVEQEANRRGQTVSKYIRDLITSVYTTKSQTNSVYTDSASVYTVFNDIINAVERQGGDSAEFLRVLNDKLNNYEIVYERGEIRIGK